MTIPKFEADRSPGELLLMCPCGGTYLHQGAVEVWTRGEDAPVATVVRADGGTARVEVRVTVECPSPRRDGLTIEMACEQCSKTRCLVVYQHKGETYMRWQEVSR